jgi:CRP-like cAMP-binding protein
MSVSEQALLGSGQLLAGLASSALDEVARAGRRRSVPSGEAVFRQGDPADTIYVWLAGRVKVSQITPDGQQVTVHFVGPGEMMGCVAAWGGGRYPGTAGAIEDSRVIGWTRPELEGLAQRHPAISRNVLTIVGRRLQESQARVRELSTERVEQRVAHALLRLADQAGRSGPGGIEIAFPLSRQDLAELAGTTLHSVSRTLSAWDQQGLIRSGRQRVLVRRTDALRTIAGLAPDDAVVG